MYWNKDKNVIRPDKVTDVKYKVYLDSSMRRMVAVTYPRSYTKQGVIAQLNTRFGKGGWYYVSKYTGNKAPEAGTFPNRDYCY